MGDTSHDSTGGWQGFPWLFPGSVQMDKSRLISSLWHRRIFWPAGAGAWYPSLQLSGALPLKVRQCKNSKANFQAILNVAKKESQESRIAWLPAACFLADLVLLQQAKSDLFIPPSSPPCIGVEMYELQFSNKREWSRETSVFLYLRVKAELEEPYGAQGCF